MAVARLRINPMLLSRITVDDLIQEVYLKAIGRLEYFRQNPEVPVFAKLRTLLLQTIVDLERKYLACQKRDVHKEVSFDQASDETGTAVRECWNMIADTITSPRTKLARAERYELLRKVLADMPDNDREILELRHFEELSNAECAGVLNISSDAASIRYVRALKHFQKKLIAFSEFRK